MLHTYIYYMKHDIYTNETMYINKTKQSRCTRVGVGVWDIFWKEKGFILVARKLKSKIIRVSGQRKSNQICTHLKQQSNKLKMYKKLKNIYRYFFNNLNIHLQYWFYGASLDVYSFS